MKRTCILVIAAAALLSAAGAAQAKTCKDPISITSRSSIPGTPEARTKRATANAEKRWSKEARAKYGLQYQFVMRGDARTVDCHPTPKSAVCKLTVTPCSLL